MTACRARGLSPVAAVLCLAAMSCLAGGASAEGTAAGAAPQPAAGQSAAKLIQTPASGPLAGHPLPATMGRDWLGRTVSFSQYRGRPLALWCFNAATCGYCVLEAQAFGSLAQQLAAIGVPVAGVNTREGQRDILEYLKRARWEGTVLVEPAALNPGGYPVDAVVSPTGLVVQQLQGVTPEETFAAAVAQLPGGGAAARYHIPGGLKLSDTMIRERDSLIIVGSEEWKRGLEDGIEQTRKNYLSQGLVSPLPHVRLAQDVTEQELTQSTVSVMGTPDTNPFFTRLAGRAPVRFLADGIEIGGVAYRGRGISWGVCFPNPWNPSKYLCAGHAEWTDADYYVRDAQSDRAGGGVAWYDNPVVKGVFDKTDPVHWRYSAQLTVTRTPHPEPLVKSCPAEGTPDLVWPSLASAPVSTPVRVAWSPPQRVGRGVFPALATAGSATWVAHAQKGAVYVARLGEGQAQRVSGRGDAYGPALVTDRAGQVWVAWAELQDSFYRIFLAHNSSHGWSGPELVSPRDVTDDAHAAVTITSHGDVCVAWYRWRANSRCSFLRIRHADGAWDPVEPISDGMFEWYPSLAEDHSGLLWACWTQHYPDGVFVAFRDLTKGWQSYLLAKEQWHPQLVASSVPALVWEEGPRGTSLVDWESTPEGSDGKRRIAFSRLEGGKWRERIGITPPELDARNPVLAQDASGRLFVAFEAREQPTGSWQVYVVRQQGEGWGQPVRVSQGPADSRAPAIAAGDGKVVVAWHRGMGTDWQIETAVGEVSPADPAGKPDACIGGICPGR